MAKIWSAHNDGYSNRPSPYEQKKSSIEPVITACQGQSHLDGTVYINHTACSGDVHQAHASCEQWIQQKKTELGSSYIRDTGCSDQGSNDVAGCPTLSTAQIFCRNGPHKNTDPEFCVRAIDSHEVTSADELRNCLSAWAFKERGAAHPDDVARHNFSEIKTFSPFIKLVYGCATSELAIRNACFFDLALNSHDSRLCLMDSDPYRGDSGKLHKSQPDCLSRLQIEHSI